MVSATALIAAMASVVNLVPAQQAEYPAPGPTDPLGVYRSADGSLLGVRPLRDGNGLRYLDFATGESHRMHPAAQDRYRSAADWSSEAPLALRYRFVRAPDGAIRSLEVRRGEAPPGSARRVSLPTRDVSFTSGGVELRGRLVLPDSGSGPFPVVIHVQGSGESSAVEGRVLPYFWAANGVAGFVYDKRGTGGSGGEFTQMFTVLASDVVAAVDRLRRMPEVDADRIGVAGFSQGGWVGPLAASMEPAVRFVFVGYGLAMSVAEEDRLEAPLKLREKGLSEEAIREFEELNAVLHETVREGFTEEGWERVAAAVEEYRDRPWMEEVRGSGTWVGQLLGMGVEKARVVVPQMFDHFIDPFYDPVPTLESLEIPMMWVIAGEDIEAPPGPTIETIRRLRGEGKPVDLAVFPGTDHGMVTFEEQPNGQRVTTGVVPGYHCLMMDWIRRHALRR